MAANKLTPAMDSALAMLTEYGTRKNGQGINLGTARALHKRGLAELTEHGKGEWTLTGTEVTQESADVKPAATHRVTWYDANAENGVSYESVTLVSEDITHAYGTPYGTARVIGEDGTERTIDVNVFAAKAITPIAEVNAMADALAKVRAIKAGEPATQDTQESALAQDDPTHVITFLDGSTERVKVISSTFDRGEHYGQTSGSVTALSVNGAEYTYRFGPSGDGYNLETVEEYDTRTSPATDEEISAALEILSQSGVESHKTSIREKVAVELHTRKLAVMETAGSDTWWGLRLWEPSDSYDTPSTDAFVTVKGATVRVYDVNEYTQDSRVQYDDGTDGYVSVFDIVPVSKVATCQPASLYAPQMPDLSQETGSSAEFIIRGCEVVVVRHVTPDGTAYVSRPAFHNVPEGEPFPVSVWDLTPERDYEYSEEMREAAREGREMIREDVVSALRVAAMDRAARGDELADWERDLLASVSESDAKRSNLRPETPERVARREARRREAERRAATACEHQRPGTDYEDLAIDMGHAWQCEECAE
ncbi:hypothetical protein [Nonomuraea roseoviolacea]|uniref:hypothetical protein n=1 Tax=Nonomuraea roseoviolacea TaxID=103837 RepID=UPI0031E48380